MTNFETESYFLKAKVELLNLIILLIIKKTKEANKQTMAKPCSIIVLKKLTWFVSNKYILQQSKLFKLATHFAKKNQCDIRNFNESEEHLGLNERRCFLPEFVDQVGLGPEVRTPGLEVGIQGP